jgi:hypothetical protein
MCSVGDVSAQSRHEAFSLFLLTIDTNVAKGD